MRSQNPWYLGLLIGLFCIASSYSAVALFHYYSYSCLTAHTPAKIEHFSVEVAPQFILRRLVKQFSGEDYVIRAAYSFSLKEKKYHQETLFSQQRHYNPWAAAEAIKVLAKQDFESWYDPYNPDHSTLQKYFPFKECVSALILWGLLFYFIWLGIYTRSSSI